MIYQISSGQGPAECELGVAKMLAYLENEYEITVLDAAPGRNPGTFRSARLETDEDLTRYAGSVQWVCRSPYRPNHGRKNWFLDFAVCARPETEAFRPDKVVFRTMHSGGRGGQNVNKVETGVQATYLPTGDTVECTDERSQYQNRRIAVERLRRLVEERNAREKASAKNTDWQRHAGIQRGNARSVFTGPEFRPKP